MNEESKFKGNIYELRKIIKEAWWDSPKDLEVAIEFVDAIDNDHNDEIEEIKKELGHDDSYESLLLEENDEDRSDWINPEECDLLDYGLGHFHFVNTEMNLTFRMELEKFVEQFKNQNNTNAK